jgi:sugar phosphate isomerase/epimerase
VSHARICVSDVCFGEASPVEDDLAALARAGIRRAGIRADKLDARGLQLVRRSGVVVEYLNHRGFFTLDRPARGPAELARARRTVDAARALGATFIYGTTGGSGGMLAEEAGAAIARAFPDLIAYGAERGVAIAVEPSNPQFGGVNAIHGLGDAIAVAAPIGLKLCVDVHACWTERGLRDSIRRAAGEIVLVQVADFRPDRISLVRHPVGDGVIPLERILGWVLEDGYGGAFDVELFGYADSGEPLDAGLARSVDRLAAMLDRLGA